MKRIEDYNKTLPIVELCKQARVTMSKLRKHIDAIWEHYDIG